MLYSEDIQARLELTKNHIEDNHYEGIALLMAVEGGGKDWSVFVDLSWKLHPIHLIPYAKTHLEQTLQSIFAEQNLKHINLIEEVLSRTHWFERKLDDEVVKALPENFLHQEPPGFIKKVTMSIECFLGREAAESIALSMHTVLYGDEMTDYALIHSNQ